MNSKHYKTIIRIVFPFALAAGVFAFSNDYDMFESFYEFSRKYEHLELDELFPVIIAMTFYLIVILVLQKQTLKQKNREIENSLNDKNLLLKEIQHRQKNDINMILGLLKLDRGNFSDNDSYTEILDNTISKLESMSVLYEQLQFSRDFEQIQVKEYFQSYFRKLGGIISGGRTAFEVNIQDFSIKAAQLFPLAIIINELFTNSMKYAFGESGGFISLKGSLHGNTAEFIYSDNGKGFPENSWNLNSTESDALETEAGNGFGRILVKNLAAQLDAETASYNDNGAVFKIKFNLH